MPKSKRDKEVSLTKTKKKTKEGKGKKLEKVQECVANYTAVYVLALENLRSNKLLQVRQQFKASSQIFYGNNNLMAVALGKSEEDEVEPDIHKISQALKGECALMFTNEKTSAIKKYFDEFIEEDFARSGSIVEEEIVLPKGPITHLAGPIEPHLRKLGLPTKLVKGSIELTDDYIVCKAGDVLTPDQAKILKLFDMKSALSKITVRARWVRGKGYKSMD